MHKPTWRRTNRPKRRRMDRREADRLRALRAMLEAKAVSA